jgi:hypothetical protein
MLYLVKWNDGTFAIVAAEDDDALVDTLDQLGDPGGASWQVYDGPLWLEFPRIDSDIPPSEEIDPFTIGIGRPSAAETDDGGEFVNAVLEAIHPELAALRAKAIHEERPITRSEFDKAVKADEGWALPGSVYDSADDGEPC